MMIEGSFSTLSLASQELISVIIDFDLFNIFVKQKGNCKYFDIVHNFEVNKTDIGDDADSLPQSDDDENSEPKAGDIDEDKLKIKIDEFPNIE